MRGLILILSLLILGCDSSPERFGRKTKALGTPNQLTVICDTELWQAPMGDTLTEYLESVYLVLPRPEPLFDLKTFTPEDLQIEELRRELRTYLICASEEDTNSPTYKMVKKHLGTSASFDKPQLIRKRDQWASGQVLLYYTAPNDSILAANFEEYLPAIVERVAEHDEKPIRSKAYLKGASAKLTKTVDTVFNLEWKIPADFVIATRADSFLWLRRDIEDMTENIMVREIPYIDTTQLTEEYIITLRNQLGGAYVETNTEGSVMVVNDKDLPVFSFPKNIDNKYSLQAKGIWEMTEDFMGGPFVTYLIVREDRRSLLYVDAFVLAPGHKKRNMMQGLEVIIESMKL